MPPPRPRPDLVGRVFRGSTAVHAGQVTRNDLRGPAWRRILPDVYADAALPITHLLSVTRRDGLAVTTADVTALDLAAQHTLDEAVVLLDRFLAARITRLDWLREAATGTTGPGCRTARAAAALADGLAGSPQETRLRLVLLRSVLPAPVAQHEVRVGGRFVARTDFAWPAHRVALEYEGAWHTRQIAADRRRIEALQAAGWRVLFVTAADLRDPAALIARIAAALAG